MGMGMGMGMTFENGYGYGYSLTRPELDPRASLPSTPFFFGLNFSLLLVFHLKCIKIHLYRLIYYR